MELEHTFTVAAPIERAWDVLLDLERIAPCMPGASLLSYDGNEFTGAVRVKLGPVTMAFNGQGRFVEQNADTRTIAIEASGKERRGGGAARATVRASLTSTGDRAATRVDVRTDLVITGRVAQLGRNMLAEVSNKLWAQFTDCLSLQFADASADAPPADVETGNVETGNVETGNVETGNVETGNVETGDSAGNDPTDDSAGDRIDPMAKVVPATASAESGPPRVEGRPIDLLELSGARRLRPYVVGFIGGLPIGFVITLLLGYRR